MVVPLSWMTRYDSVDEPKLNGSVVKLTGLAEARRGLKKGRFRAAQITSVMKF
jgi:hypothetical protein